MPSITELVYSPKTKPDRVTYCELKAKHCRNMSKVTPLPEVREYYKGLEHFWLQHMDLAKRNY